MLLTEIYNQTLISHIKVSEETLELKMNSKILGEIYKDNFVKYAFLFLDYRVSTREDWIVDNHVQIPIIKNPLVLWKVQRKAIEVTDENWNYFNVIANRYIEHNDFKKIFQNFERLQEKIENSELETNHILTNLWDF